MRVMTRFRQLPKLARRLRDLKPIHLWLAILLAGMTSGAAAGALVFWRGLVVTNLTDLVPWGLWITIDLSSIALSAGAFLLSAAVYLLGLKKFQGLARTAVFVGLVGYSMAVLSLMLDIGRPDRFWHALVYWNPHSVLWEVTMCVMLYFSVLTLETAPIIAAWAPIKQRWPAISARVAALHGHAPALAVVGLGLSMLHQSSLGATYGVLKARPIWFRPDLSVLFILSAMAAGPALIVFVSSVSAKLSSRAKVDQGAIDSLARFVGWVLVGYLYFRFWDAFAMTYTTQPGRDEGLGLILNGPLAFNFWAGEMILGALVPAVILLREDFRRNFWARTAAMALVVGGLVAYRWDTNLVGQLVVVSYLPNQMAASFTRYTPSLIEFLAGGGIISYGLFAITIGIRYLKIVDHQVQAAELDHSPARLPVFAGAGD